jgi:hypothetical protein
LRRSPRPDAGDGDRSPARELFAQRLALDVLVDDEAKAAGLADLVDGDDVRVVEGGGGARLQLEARHAVGVGGERAGEELERDAAAEALVHGEVDLAHPAAPDLALDAVVAELSPRE